MFGALSAWFIPHAFIPVGLGYTDDPVANVESGPWFPWTHLVCGVALVAIAVIASWNRYWPTVFLLIPTLLCGWSFTASGEDITGLWLVGLIVMSFFTVLGTLAVVGAMRLVWSLSARRKSAVARGKRLPPLPA